MLILLFAYLMSISANAQVRFAPNEGRYEAKGEFQYLTTSANYPSGGGSSAGLFGGAKLSRMLGVAEVSYDLSPAIRFWGGFSGGQTTAVVVNAPASVLSTVTETHTVSGLNEGYLGGQWWTEFQQFDIVPQIDFVFPFWRVNTGSPTALLGEGAMRLQAGSWFMLPRKDVTPFGYIGAAYRDGGRSALLPYSVGARFNSDKFWIEGEFRGYQSITNDSNSSQQNVRDAYLNLVDGGSYEFDAINPSRSEISLMAGVRIEQIEFYLGGSKTVFGRSAADDWQARVGLSFNGQVFPRSPRAATPTTDRFIEAPEKYDDSVFHDQVTPDPIDEQEALPPPPPKAAPPAARVHPRAKPKVKRPKKDAPMPNVELLMKDTQKSLEKKGH